MKQISIIFILVLFLSCENNSLKVVNLKTDLPEITPLVESFNSASKNIKITINDSAINDMYIYRGQKDDMVDKGKDLSYLFEKKIDKEIFYTDILSNTMNTDGTFYVLPLTFNVNGLIYNDKNFNNTNTVDINYFLKTNNLRFSPFWEEEFILWDYLSNIPSFDLNKNYYDEDEFLHIVELMNNVNLNRTDDWNLQLFNEKYMHLSPERLIETSLIDYYFYNLSDYMSINKKYYPNIKFSILSSDGLIPIKDQMLYVGINRDSKKTAETDQVIAWIFNEVNQSKIIESSTDTYNSDPLFLKELSTLKKVSNDIIPNMYPELEMLIPQADIMITPSNLPPLWDSLRYEVFLPIFNEVKKTPLNNLYKKYMEYYNDWSKKHNK